jgi:hypothetical protein
MHIVIIAWLFVTFTMALTMKSWLLGVALFAVLGLGPVLLYLALAVRRLRSRASGVTRPAPRAPRR